MKNMKKKLSFLMLLFLSAAVFAPVAAWAAAPSIEWQKCLGGSGEDIAYSAQRTPDDGYIFAGRTTSTNGDVSGNHGGSDAWVVKLNSSGAIAWQKCLGGTDYDYAFSIQLTSDGGYIIAGNTLSNNGDVSGNHGDYDAWVVKLNSSGAIEWQKCLGGSGDDRAFSIYQTIDGGYIVAGSTTSNDGNVSGNHGFTDAWVVKLNSSGVIAWQKCLGGGGTDSAYSIQQTSDGGYIIAGDTSSNDGDVSGNHGGTDAWVVKLNPSGTIVWQKCLGGSSGEVARSIQQKGDGSYIVAGYTSSNDGDVSGNHGSYDFWVVKLNSSGAIEWQKCLGGADTDFAYSIQQTGDGYIVAGETNSTNGDVSGNHGGYRDMWVARLNSSGTIVWQKCFGGSDEDYASSIIRTSYGGYIVAGHTNSTNGDVSGNHGGVSDMWVVKLNPDDTSVPGAPTNVTAAAGNGKATVSFTPPTSDGGSAITNYTVTSSPGGITKTGASSPITVTGLTNGTAYTFTVTATNVIGSSVASIASSSITPVDSGGGGGGCSATGYVFGVLALATLVFRKE